MCLEVSGAWNKHRSPLDKQANWADVVRHGIALAHAEHKRKRGKSDPRQLELPTRAKPAKKKTTKKKAAKKAPKKTAKKGAKKGK